MKKKTTVTFSRPKTLQNLIYGGQTLRNVTLKLWRPVTLSRKCSPGKLSEKGTNFKQNANYFDFSTTKRIFILTHKHALQGNEGSNKIRKEISDIIATIAIKSEGCAYHNFFYKSGELNRRRCIFDVCANRLLIHFTKK